MNDSFTHSTTNEFKSISSLVLYLTLLLSSAISVTGLQCSCREVTSPGAGGSTELNCNGIDPASCEGDDHSIVCVTTQLLHKTFAGPVFQQQSCIERTSVDLGCNFHEVAGGAAVFYVYACDTDYCNDASYDDLCIRMQGPGAPFAPPTTAPLGKPPGPPIHSRPKPDPTAPKAPVSHFRGTDTAQHLKSNINKKKKAKRPMSRPPSAPSGETPIAVQSVDASGASIEHYRDDDNDDDKNQNGDDVDDIAAFANKTSIVLPAFNPVVVDAQDLSDMTGKQNGSAANKNYSPISEAELVIETPPVALDASSEASNDVYQTSQATNNNDNDDNSSQNNDIRNNNQNNDNNVDNNSLLDDSIIADSDLSPSDVDNVDSVAYAPIDDLDYYDSYEDYDTSDEVNGTTKTSDNSVLSYPGRGTSDSGSVSKVHAGRPASTHAASRMGTIGTSVNKVEESAPSVIEFSTVPTNTVIDESQDGSDVQPARPTLSIGLAGGFAAKAAPAIRMDAKPSHTSSDGNITGSHVVVEQQFTDDVISPISSDKERGKISHESTGSNASLSSHGSRPPFAGIGGHSVGHASAAALGQLDSGVDGNQRQVENVADSADAEDTSIAIQAFDSKPDNSGDRLRSNVWALLLVVIMFHHSISICVVNVR